MGIWKRDLMGPPEQRPPNAKQLCVSISHFSDLRKCLISFRKEKTIMLFCCQSLKRLLFCFIDKYSVLRGLKRAWERNAKCHFYHLTLPGIWLLGHKNEKTTSMCWLFVYCLFLLIPPPLWIQSLSHPLICLRHLLFVHAFSMCAHACAADASRRTVCEARWAMSWATDRYHAHA